MTDMVRLEDAKVPEFTTGSPVAAPAVIIPPKADKSKYFRASDGRLREVIRWVEPKGRITDFEYHSYIVQGLGGGGAVLLGELAQPEPVVLAGQKLVRRGRHVIYLCDPATGKIERRHFGPGWQLGAVER